MFVISQDLFCIYYKTAGILDTMPAGINCFHHHFHRKFLECLLRGSSVGVLEDKSSGILEDNFEVLGLGLESQVLDLGLVTQALGKTRGHTLHQSKTCRLHFLNIIVIAACR